MSREKLASVFGLMLATVSNCGGETSDEAPEIGSNSGGIRAAGRGGRSATPGPAGASGAGRSTSNNQSGRDGQISAGAPQSSGGARGEQGGRASIPNGGSNAEGAGASSVADGGFATGGFGGTNGGASGDDAGQGGMISGAGASTGQAGASSCDIPEGTRFEVSVLSETSTSHACHVAVPSSTFEMVAAAPVVSASAECTTPGTWAPDQSGVQIVRCSPAAATGVLGVECEMRYQSSCPGLIRFFFQGSPSTDWSAPVVEGVLLRVADSVDACLPNRGNCRDEYLVRLERL